MIHTVISVKKVFSFSDTEYFIVSTALPLKDGVFDYFTLVKEAQKFCEEKGYTYLGIISWKIL